MWRWLKAKVGADQPRPTGQERISEGCPRLRGEGVKGRGELGPTYCLGDEMLNPRCFPKGILEISETQRERPRIYIPGQEGTWLPLRKLCPCPVRKLRPRLLREMTHTWLRTWKSLPETG